MVERLELKRIRVCARCGRGRAELEGTEGHRLVVPLDPPRARVLEQLSGTPEAAGEAVGAKDASTRTVADFVLAQLDDAGAHPTDVVLDHGPAGLQAFLSFEHDDGGDVIACTAQEGVELAVRAGLPLYGTDEALGRNDPEPDDPAGRPTLH